MLFSFISNYIIIRMVKKMSKGNIYKIERGSKNNKKYTPSSGDFVTFAVGIIVYAIVLVLASNLFRGIYVENFFYAIIAALILSLLNSKAVRARSDLDVIMLVSLAIEIAVFILSPVIMITLIPAW